MITIWFKKNSWRKGQYPQKVYETIFCGFSVTDSDLDYFDSDDKNSSYSSGVIIDSKGFMDESKINYEKVDISCNPGSLIVVPDQFLTDKSLTSSSDISIIVGRKH